jgi:hypothetical protein
MYMETSAPEGAPAAARTPYAPEGPSTVNVRTAARRNVEDGRGFSLYLQEVGRMVEGRPESYVLVMPDEDGTLPKTVMSKRTGIVVSWPTNPHNTGEAGILNRLNDSKARAMFGVPVTHAGYAADQDGRHWRTC